MSFDFIITITRGIRSAWRCVWQIWVWLRVLWYALFLRFSSTCWRVYFWCFCIWRLCTNRSRVQRWLTPFNIFALKLKVVMFHPNFRIIFIVFSTIVFFLPTASPTAALCPTAWSAALQWMTSGDLLILVAGIQILENLLSKSTAESPWFTNCGATGLAGSIATGTPHRAYRSLLEILESSWMNIWVKTGGTIGLLENFPSTEEFNSSEFLIFVEVDWRILPILGLHMPPACGAALVPLISMGAGVEVPLIPINLVPTLSLGAGVEVSPIPLWTEVVISMLVLTICRGVLFVPVFFWRHICDYFLYRGQLECLWRQYNCANTWVLQGRKNRD